MEMYSSDGKYLVVTSSQSQPAFYWKKSLESLGEESASLTRMVFPLSAKRHQRDTIYFIGHPIPKLYFWKGKGIQVNPSQSEDGSAFSLQSRSIKSMLSASAQIWPQSEFLTNNNLILRIDFVCQKEPTTFQIEANFEMFFFNQSF